MRVRLVVLLVVLMYSAVFCASAQMFNTAGDCEKAPLQCIEYTENALVSTEPHSFEWYHLKNLNLSAHWQLVHFETLRAQLPDLVELTKAPAVFRVTVLTIYSKLLLDEGKTELGHRFVDEAINLIQDVNAVNMSPDRAAELVVLLNAIGELEQADQVGSDLLKAFEQSRRPIELGDVYTALGHTQFMKGQFAAAQARYQSALKSYSDMHHGLEMANTQHNIARTYQELGQLTQAIDHFNLSLTTRAELASNADPRNEHYTRIRFVEALLAAGREEEAKREFIRIECQHVLDSHRALYETLFSLGQPTC